MNTSMSFASILRSDVAGKYWKSRRTISVLIVIAALHFSASSVAHAQANSGPSIIAQAPLPGATAQAVNSRVSVTFNENVQAGSISFVIRDSSSAVVPSTIQYNSTTNIATLIPTAELLPLHTYTATVSGAKDAAGNSMSQPMVWSFSTGLPGFQESIVFKGLHNPTAFQFASDGRIFVAQKDGQIFLYQSLTDTNPTIFADLRTDVYSYQQDGLLGMALDPKFPTVPYVYVFYTYDAAIGGNAPTWGTAGSSDDTCSQPSGSCVVSGRLSRLQANGNVMAGTEQVLINDWYEQYPGQSVGNLAFGPDGLLYATAGDGANSTLVDYGQTDSTSPDPVNEGGALRSQDLRTPADPVTLDGSVIRIDPNTALPLRKTYSMIVGTPTVDANGVKSYPVTSVYQGSQQQIIRVLEPTSPVAGKPRRFLYVLPVATGVTNTSSMWSDGLEELRLLDVPNRFNMTLIAPSFNYEPWYGDSTSDPTHRMESFIVNDLVPFGDTFAQGTGVPQRFLIGFSKSGNGALYLLLRHPNVFSAAAIWDAPAQLSDITAFDGLPLNFGTQANFNLYNIPAMVASNARPFQAQNRIWISGDQAAWTADMDQLHDQMTAASIQHTWVQGGVREHSWNSGWLDGAVTALDANATSTAPVDINEQRIIAYGLRNPRLAFRPDTQEIWIADQGWNTTEEIDRIPDATSEAMENFGWPCYEGNGTTAYSGFGICSLLYSQTGTTTVPYFSYDHQAQVASGSDENGIGHGSISGLTFYKAGNYPDQYQGALFFSDSARNNIWAILKGSNGLPDPNNVSSFLLGAADPADLKTGPNGDLFYADMNGGTIRRITYTKPVVRSNAQPSGVLPSGTTQTTVSLVTDRSATCRFATVEGITYQTMTNTFTSTGGTSHSTLMTGLVDGGNYNLSVRCEDASGNANQDDYLISFSVAKAGDVAPPVLSNGQPTGVLAAGSTQTIMSVATSESATCRYANTPGVAFEIMGNTFSSTGGTVHTTPITGLVDGGRYSYYVRCRDGSGNANLADYVISYSVDTTGGQVDGGIASSTFSGVEDPLSESGLWDKPGSWTALKKNNGAYTTQTTSAARLVTPLTGADQYAEITYDQDPGSSSWPGVMTRVQGAANGSGYLAIAYAGQVILYRAVDTGYISFTQLASATAPVATAPRRLRLESQGTTHRVYFNGVLMLTFTDSTYATGQPGIADAIFGGPTVKILSFTGGILTTTGTGPVDTIPPVRSNGQPAGNLAAGTTQTTISLLTDENATCRYATTAGVAYSAMTNTFSTTGGTAHATLVTGLTDGNSYSYYVRCQDGSGNANADDFTISFSTGSTAGHGSTASSTFTGAEDPLSENGRWDKPGSWTALKKNDGAYTTQTTSAARLVTPQVGADQYAEITYDQDPGSASWPGVMTRIQGASNGSGYLAIAYAGQVVLYRAVDSGWMGFTALASASAPVATAPRRLRLESQGTMHRVYFNGVLMLTITDSTYTAGQPGIADAIFGGPTVKILSFTGGSLSNAGSGAGDTTPPARSNGQPTGTLTGSTTQTSISLSTDENATCRYATSAGVAYSAMTNSFTTTGAITHSTLVTGLVGGGTYSYYVRCQDVNGNANTDDFIISFSVDTSVSGNNGSTVASTFSGVEDPLSESGMWDKPGSWTPLKKNNGAYTTQTTSAARLVTPLLSADQYAEITFDQDPGSSSWPGVMTRVQGAANGSGYLAIAYAGQIILYRTDDIGWLSFTALGSVSAPIGTAPRHLRLESQGATHKVYFNGVLMMAVTDGTYTMGQPGTADAIFGGPTVKILSFNGGSLAQN